jgi:tRNA threonylcarbamoyladenosine biosynthesis protein TsaE
MGRKRIENCWILNSAEETFAFGKILAPHLPPNTILALSGDLGAGKTTFVQGLALGLGIKEEISSPTFVYLNIYEEGVLPLFHFDLYRLKSPADFVGLGFDEYLSRGGICAIEWPEKTELPPQAIQLYFTYNACGRTVRLAGANPDLLYSLANLWD